MCRQFAERGKRYTTLVILGEMVHSSGREEKDWDSRCDYLQALPLRNYSFLSW